MNENIKCHQCGEQFKGMVCKEDTCPDCLRSSMKCNGKHKSREDIINCEDCAYVLDGMIVDKNQTAQLIYKWVGFITILNSPFILLYFIWLNNLVYKCIGL